MKQVSFTKHLVSVFLAASVVFLGGCFSKSDGQQSGGGKPSDLAGHWVHASGRTSGMPEDMELYKDGTGIVDKASITWKVENKRLVLLSALQGMSCDYKISGDELTLVYNDDGIEVSEVFVKLEEEPEKLAEQLYLCVIEIIEVRKQMEQLDKQDLTKNGESGILSHNDPRVVAFNKKREALENRDQVLENNKYQVLMKKIDGMSSADNKIFAKAYSKILSLSSNAELRELGRQALEECLSRGGDDCI